MEKLNQTTREAVERFIQVTGYGQFNQTWRDCTDEIWDAAYAQLEADCGSFEEWEAACIYLELA